MAARYQQDRKGGFTVGDIARYFDVTNDRVREAASALSIVVREHPTRLGWQEPIATADARRIAARFLAEKGRLLLRDLKKPPRRISQRARS